MSARFEHQWNEQTGSVRRLSVTLESRVESADIAESLILEFSGKAGCDGRQMEEIGLAVRESVANAVCHGNRCDLTKKVVMTAEFRHPELVIRIRDEGEGFDPEVLADPLLPDNLLHESGRGFFLMKTCMDDVTVRRIGPRGVELTMIKHVFKAPHRRILK